MNPALHVTGERVDLLTSYVVSFARDFKFHQCTKIAPSRSQTPPSNWIRVCWRTSPEILGFLTWLVRSSHVIINIFTIVGGVWS